MKVGQIFSGGCSDSFRKQLNALLEDSVILSANLEKQRLEREANPCRFYLSAIAESCECKVDELNQANKTRQSKSYLRNIAVKEMVSKADGNLISPNYSEGKRSEQELYVYCGTHWVEATHTMCIEFTKACCTNMGFDEEYVQDHAFMAGVMQQLAFYHAKDLEQKIIPGVAEVNLLNGTVEIREDGTYKFREHRREDYFPWVIPYRYNPNAQCPMFDKFLDEVVPDKAAQQFLFEYIGSFFAPGAKVELALFLYGPGGNGKSVLLEIIEHLVGKANVSNVPLDELTNNDKKRALIENKVVNISTETKGDIDHSKLKCIISGEAVDAYVNYRGPITIRNCPKLITAVNDMPRPEDTHGYRRRIKIIPFNTTIPTSKRDIRLAQKIVKDELPGILNKVLEALARLSANKFQFTQSKMCDDAMEDYINSSDSVKLFVHDTCEKPTDNRVKMKLRDLYRVYCTYCREGNMKFYTRTNFEKKINALGYNVFPYSNVKCINIKCNYDDENRY